MSLTFLLLFIALALYAVVALHPRRFGLSINMTAVGLVLICSTLLVAAGLI